MKQKVNVKRTPPDAELTAQIKTDYRAGAINFVDAAYELRQVGHTPAEAQKIVAALIKEKHDDN